jgi:Pvc16 N-terminal domain
MEVEGMSNYPVINHVGSTLKQLLADYFSADPTTPGLLALNDIALLPPDHPDMGTSYKLSIYLYGIKENPHLKNRLQDAQNGSTNTLGYPPLSLDFFYLITPDSGNYESDNLILGKVMQVFHDHAVLSGSILAGTLAGSDEQLRVVLHAPPMDEIFQLWQSFQEKSFRLSLCYQVTPVSIDSLRQTTVQRVVQAGEEWAQLSTGGTENG